MAGRKVRARFGHAPGLCAAASVCDGSAVLTSGSDALVHAVRLAGDDEAAVAAGADKNTVAGGNRVEVRAVSELQTDAGVGAMALSPRNDVLATGDDEAHVRLFSLPARERSEWGAPDAATLLGIGARFAAPVRALAFAPSGSLVAAAGDEPGIIKLIATATLTTAALLKSPGRGRGDDAIKALAYDPRGDYVVSVGARGGAVSVWSIEADDAYVADVSFGAGLATCAAWSPRRANILAVGGSCGVVLCGRDAWSASHPLARLNGGHARNAVVTALSWSPNARYLVTADNEGIIVLWRNLPVESSVSSELPPPEVLDKWNVGAHAVQTIEWVAARNAVLALDSIGQYAVLHDVVPESMPSPLEAYAVAAGAAVGGDNASDAERSSAGADAGALFDEDDDSNAKANAQDGALKDLLESESLVVERMRKDRSGGDEDGADDDFGRIDEREDSLTSGEIGAGDRESGRESADDHRASDDDEHGDDDGAEYEHDERSGRRRASSRRRHRRGGSSGHAAVLRAAQASFMPGSTPEHPRRRILCWNRRGVMVSHVERTHNTIEINFAGGAQSDIRIKDHYGYSLGVLGEHGALFAAPPTAQHAATVFFRAFGAWSKNADWTLSLPSSERAEAVALSSSFAAVVSSSLLLRIFSLSGLQTDAVPLSCPAVTLAAAGCKLAVVTAATLGLHLTVYELNDHGEIARESASGPLPLSPGASLEWLGFSSGGADDRSASASAITGGASNDAGRELVAYDSAGRVIILADTSARVEGESLLKWRVVLENASKSAGAKWFWLAAVKGDEVVGVACHGRDRWPSASNPRPLFSTLPLRTTTIDGAGALSEALLRARAALNCAHQSLAVASAECSPEELRYLDALDAVTDAELHVDKCILKLLEEACRANRGMRALELTARLSRSTSIELAHKLATHYKQAALADRVSRLSAQRAAQSRAAATLAARRNAAAQGKLDVAHAAAAPEPKMGLAASHRRSSGAANGGAAKRVFPPKRSGNRKRARQGTMADVVGGRVDDADVCGGDIASGLDDDLDGDVAGDGLGAGFGDEPVGGGALSRLQTLKRRLGGK